MILSKKFFKSIILSLLIITLSPQKALAVCPVCTVAVGAGVGFSRWLGIDDTITGLWIGGFLLSFFLWTINFLDQKKIKFKGRKISLFLGYYLLVLIPLSQMGIIGHPYNQLFGIDKLFFGTTVGTFGFASGMILHNQLKEKNNQKVYFPLQRVIIPILVLALLSAIFYFITKT